MGLKEIEEGVNIMADELQSSRRRIAELETALRRVCNAFQAKGCRLEVNAAAMRMTDAIIGAKKVLGDLG